MEKVKQLFDAIVGADAWYIAGSPLLDTITNVDEPNGDPENEVLNFTWVGDDEGTEFSESITEEDLVNATVNENGNSITIHDPDGDFEIVLYSLVPFEIELAPATAESGFLAVGTKVMSIKGETRGDFPFDATTGPRAIGEIVTVDKDNESCYLIEFGSGLHIECSKSKLDDKSVYQVITGEVFDSLVDWDVTVCRTGTATCGIKVKARFAEEAEETALRVAGDFKYREFDADYEVLAVAREGEYRTHLLSEFVVSYEDNDPEASPRFRNHYVCPHCSNEWDDEWDSTCDDECGQCGRKNISPTESESIAVPVLKFVCLAEDAAHAIDQAKNAYPNATVIGAVLA